MFINSGDNAIITTRLIKKELSLFKGDADAKGASVATKEALASPRSSQRGYSEVNTKRNGGGYVNAVLEQLLYYCLFFHETVEKA